MTKLRLFTISTYALLGVNIVLLAFIFLSTPDRPRPSQLSAQRELGLTEEQNQAFTLSADEHKRRMGEINSAQRDLLSQHFAQLTALAPLTPQPLPDAFLQLEAEKVNTTYQHFQSIKQLLTPEQRELYPNFMDLALNRILLGERKNPPPPKD